MTNIWIESLKNKYRFEFKGLINIEDLFDLKLEDLDTIYRNLKKQEQDLEGDSLLETKDNPAKAEIENKILVVKEIFNMKQAEIEANKRALANKAQKAKILSIIENKQDQELSEKSIEELKEIYDNLG
jgi:recombination DNA repair RAD52 pathway protein